MKHYVFKDSITDVSVSACLNFLDQNPEHEIAMYFSTNGGYTGAAVFLAKAINNREKPVYVHLGDDLHSSGFVFAYNLKRNIVFSDYLQTYAIIHNCSTDVTTIQPARDFALASIDNSNAFMLEEFKFLTLAEQMEFKLGNDVVLSYQRLKEIFSEKIVKA